MMLTLQSVRLRSNISLALSLCASLCAVVSVLPAKAFGQETDRPVVSALDENAKALLELVQSAAVKEMLDAVEFLPEPTSRVIWTHRERRDAISAQEYDRLTPEARQAWEEKTLEPSYYYMTRAGNPLIYARPLDLMAQRWQAGDSVEQSSHQPSFAGRRIFDFGYGTVGHLRVLATVGADCTGSEVDPVLRVLYSRAEDQGQISTAKSEKPGHVRLIHGRWPAEPKVAEAVGGNYDLIMSKNVLKAGYIHPAREVDKRFLIDLGVDDDQFLKAVFDALKPGGHFLIYNISPAQNPDDQPYIPWADGKSPFSREQFEEHGFVVHMFDEVDQDQIVRWWKALGYDEGKDAESLKRELFAWYTIVLRPTVRND